MTQPSLKNRIQSNADLCVKCGACLPFCPTFRVTGDENESPRGRIALLDALARTELTADTHFKTHIDQCLGCRSCESVCPAHVPYGKLLTDGRELLNTTLPQNHFYHALIHVLAFYPRLTRIAFYLLQKARAFLPRRWRTAFKTVGWENVRETHQTQTSKQPFKDEGYKAFTKQAKGTVGLFVGCTGETLDRATLDASIFVLRHLGFNVRIPKTQRCCGAIHLHHGLKKGSDALLKRNVAAFSEEGLDALIGFTSGCVAPLSTHNGNFRTRIYDIVRFIHEHWEDTIQIAPRTEQVAVHVPCSQSHMISNASQPLFLLQKIPALKTVPFPQSSICCGGAGTYFLEHPTLSQQVFLDFIQDVQELPSLIVTSNIGCALQFQTQLQHLYPHRTFQIMHPVVLLATQIMSKNSA